MTIREVGGYQLLRQIGFGGMSTVYEAVNGAGDHVALKLLHPSLAADETSRLRLKREVAVLRRVRSPYVAEVIDAEFDAVEPFIVTELVHGLTLEEDVQRNGLYTEEDLLQLGVGLGEALAAVHAVGVLHRDLKPSNVMIAESSAAENGDYSGLTDGGSAKSGADSGSAESDLAGSGSAGALQSRPILIDFGISQAQGDTRLTRTGALALTPGYCDPRVLRGEEPDSAADWWALAAVLAYAATGVPPFGGGTAPAVIKRVLGSEPNLPDLEPELARAFRAALAPDAAQRLSYSDLLTAIAAPQRAPAFATPSFAAAPTIAVSAAAPAWAAGELPPTQALPASELPLPEWRAPAAAELPAPSSAADETAADGMVTHELLLPEEGESAARAVTSAEQLADGEQLADDEQAEPSLLTIANTHPEQLPPWAREPKKVRLLVGLIGMAAMLVGVRYPGIVVVALALLVLLLDVVGSSADWIRTRSLRRGSSDPGDVPVMLLRLPLTLLVSILRTAGRAIGAGAIAWAVLWLSAKIAARRLGMAAGECIAASASASSGWQVWPMVVAIGMAIFAVLIWFLPFGQRARLGARYSVAGMLPSRLAKFLLGVLALVAIIGAGALAYSALRGVPVRWAPFPAPLM